MMSFHTPVLCKEVKELLLTVRGGTYVDATLGGGGHSAAMLKALKPEGRVIGIDRDEQALEAAQSRLGEWPNFEAVHGNFSSLRSLLTSLSVGPVDGLLLDLGVSSHQLDSAERGFSHRRSADLDMRMDQNEGGHSAHTVVNQWPQKALTSMLFEWGEEPRALRIARAIVAARPILATTDLARVVRKSVPVRHESKTLARVFQAIRIAVNEEIEALEAVLDQAPSVVKIGGRMAVLSYHSLEDRRVKRTMRSGNLDGEPVRDLYGNSLSPWRPLLRKPVRARK